MEGFMGQVLFVVWRESVEALLVIGILFTWIVGRPDSRRWLPWLWGGVALGLAGAVALGLLILFAGEVLSESAQTLFQTGLMLLACALIVQMVVWMRRHGRTLKREMHTALESQAGRSHGWGVLLLSAIAVVREGSETVVFLYGIGQHLVPFEFVLATVAGLALAGLTFVLLQLGGKYVSWRWFFRVTEVLLLLLGAAMLMSAVDNLLSLEILPAIVDPLWDSSAFINDGTAGGGLIASFTGYRAYPALTSLLIYLAYWALVIVLMRMPRADRKPVQA
jgi:high-affinity iron transporter